MGSSQCVAVFEFVTNEACATVPAVPEIPCSLYDPDNKLRDLTPLIKLKGKVYQYCAQRTHVTNTLFC